MQVDMKEITIRVHVDPNPEECLDDIETFFNEYIGKPWYWSDSNVENNSAWIKDLNIWYLSDLEPEDEEEEEDEEEVPF